MSDAPSFELINPNLFVDDGGGLSHIRLRGTECLNCHEVFFGRRLGCESCSSRDLREFALGEDGVVHSVAVLRATPPGDYLDAEGFDTLTVALVEMREGVRILSPIASEGPVGIGDAVALRLVTHPRLDALPVVTYSFATVGAAA